MIKTYLYISSPFDVLPNTSLEMGTRAAIFTWSASKIYDMMIVHKARQGYRIYPKYSDTQVNSVNPD